MSPKNWNFSGKNIQFKKGDVIFKEREEGKEMYFIESGEVKIVKSIGNTDVNLASLSAGDFFGEMALITGNKRVASAISFTDCNLHVMEKETFDSNILNDRDFMSKILVTLALRLEESDLSLALLLKIASRTSKP